MICPHTQKLCESSRIDKFLTSQSRRFDSEEKYEFLTTRKNCLTSRVKKGTVTVTTEWQLLGCQSCHFLVVRTDNFDNFLVDNHKVVLVTTVLTTRWQPCFLCACWSYTTTHPGLAEINAPVGPQEVMPLLKDSPLRTIAQCRLGQPISNTWMQVGPMMWCRLGHNRKNTFHPILTQ